MNRFVWTLLFSVFVTVSVAAPRVYNNPILPGYYPDPSICRVGEEYYLVTSSFESFPGIPIFHSRDLVNWEQIGHVLDRPSQIALDSIRFSGGIYAPTIRYNKGVFYVITTAEDVKDPEKGGNFIVTATSPSGPWSEPYFLKGAPGIDPSLFFDDDGKVYYTGNKSPRDGALYPKHNHIWLQELDLETMQLVGPETIILSTGGALNFANNAEAPHVYKRDGYYYLTIAEGGTGNYHAVTVFRSKEIRAEFEPLMRNPILTSRHMGIKYPIQCVGHADMVETQNGEWWMVVLGCRPYGGFANLARETFLVPMVWEGAWPVPAPGLGHVALQHEAPNLQEHPFASTPPVDHFEASTLGYQWNFIRIPRGDFYSLERRRGYLSLRLKPEMITQELSAAFVGRRQQHMNFSASTVMEFTPKRPHESAGMVIYQSPKFHYRLERKWLDGVESVVVTECKKGIERVIASEPLFGKRVRLQISAQGQDYAFAYAEGDQPWKRVAAAVDGRILNSASSRGFTGIYIGMYATGNGMPSPQTAYFDQFEYLPL